MQGSVFLMGTLFKKSQMIKLSFYIPPITHVVESTLARIYIAGCPTPAPFAAVISFHTLSDALQCILTGRHAAPFDHFLLVSNSEKFPFVAVLHTAVP